MIYIEPHHLAMLQSILQQSPGCFVYGSRVKGTHKKFSDIDLCFIRPEPMPEGELARLSEQLEESNLPFTVDIVDYHSLTPAFRAIIDQDKVIFPYAQ